MRNLIWLALLPATAFAGGFEIAEQSAAGIAMVGAQTAVATDPTALYYNPAGIAFQPGLGVFAGGNLAVVETDVTGAGRDLSNPSHTAFGPNVYLSQRLGRHFAVGVGGFSNFAEHFDYGTNWPGRYQGQYVDIKTYTLNPNVAWRPIERLSIAAGFDVVISSVELSQAVNFGAADGTLHFGTNTANVGGNVALMLDIIPRWLRFGYSYRSRVDLHFDGPASLNAPPELASMVPMPTNGTVTVVLPHNMSFALSTQPTDHLLLTGEFRLTLWSDEQSLTLALQNSSGAAVSQQTVPLNLKNSYGGRFGAQYQFLGGRLPIRLGIGYDNTPVPVATLGPLLPDTDRLLVGGGLGYQGSWWALDAGYMAAILFRRTSESTQLSATFSNIGHVVSANFSGRFEKIGGTKLAVARPKGEPREYGPLRNGTW